MGLLFSISGKMQTSNGSESQQSSSKESNNESGNGGSKAVPPPPVVAAVPGQQWVAMQYPAAAMVMQHGMIPAPHYAPHYMPYHLHHHPPLPPPPPPQQPPGATSNGGGSNGENRTIWVGDLHNWMDEDYLRSCFSQTGEVYISEFNCFSVTLIISRALNKASVFISRRTDRFNRYNINLLLKNTTLCFWSYSTCFCFYRFDSYN